MTTKREELEAMTKAQIIERYGLDMDKDKTTKDTLIEVALRADRKQPTPEAETDDRDTLALLLMDCTTEFEFPRGQVHAINPGRPHTLRYVLTAEPLRHYPDEWADVTDGPFEVWLDGVLLEKSAFVHATERNRG